MNSLHATFNTIAAPLFLAGACLAAPVAMAQATLTSSASDGPKVHLGAIPSKAAAARKRAQAEASVVLYRTAWCGYCKRAAAYMRQQHIPFIEHDIEEDERSHAEYVRLGGKGSIPLILFGKQTMLGFAQETFDQYYADFQKAKRAGS